MVSNLSSNSIDSDVFYVEQSSNDRSLPRPNTSIVLNSTEMSGNDTREMPPKLSIASPEPQVVTIDSDSNEPTMPYVFGRQLPIIPPRSNSTLKFSHSDLVQDVASKFLHGGFTNLFIKILNISFTL